MRKEKCFFVLGMTVLLASCSPSTTKTDDEGKFDKQVQDWVSKGTDLNQPQGQLLNHTPLGWAVSSGYVDAVRALLDHGANANARDQNGLLIPTPLHHLGDFHNPDDHKAVEIGQMLIQKGADVNAKDENGRTPIGRVATVRATLRNKLEELFLNNGADPNIPDTNGYTVLHLMVMSNDPESVKLLANHGASVNVKANDGLTPLHTAAFLGYPNVARALIDVGADINLRDDRAGKNSIEWCQEGMQRNDKHDGSDFPATLKILQDAQAAKK